jgi:DNA invertase Pin-like site-specific DNA recombinase
MRKPMRGHYTLFIQKVEDADQKPLVMQLADVCINKGTPITEVALMFGVTRASVYNWLTGKTVPRARHQAAMPKVIARLSKRK